MKTNNLKFGYGHDKCFSCTKNEKGNKSAVMQLLSTPGILPILTQIYNTGYGSGHHDTVENCYTDVLPVDLDSYHSEIVAELMNELEG